ncbi:MAG TPA: methyltransferase domain-containing protein [Thermoanaerobaculia bacterium]|nr:methyltransferase domain-containing protein [Thermoanaerobaculia bacterium]
MASGEQLRKSWIANASVWSDTVRAQKIESRRVATDAAILDAITSCNPRDVLDLGCGEGWLARALSERGCSVIGVDASPALIEAAQKLGGGTFRVLPYEELATLATQFDVIAANFSLLDHNLHLDALRALLRPGGTLIVQTVHPAFAGEPYADGWRVETFASMEGEWPEPMPWYFRTVSSWVNAFTAGGFTLRELREPLHPETQRPLSLVLMLTL